MKIPEQYLPVMPYLIIHKSDEFRLFAKNVFGATEQLIAPGEKGKVMHGEIRIGDAVIMFAEASEQWPEKTAAMYLHVEDVDQVYQLALDNKSKELHPPQQKDYGYTAGFEDPFGNHWYVVA